MDQAKTVGFLGAGNMAEALIRGLVTARGPSGITASHPFPERRAELEAAYGITVFPNNCDLVDACEVLVICVKPQNVADVLAEVANQVTPKHLVFSVAAGLTTEALGASLPSQTRIVRAMPNTPALIGKGATGVCAGKNATPEDLQTAIEIFDAVGLTVAVPEHQINAITGLSGSGPAYVFLILDALADAGVKVGLSRRHAQRLAAQTVMGAAQLFLETNEHPGKLKDMVTSPAGTAIAGLHTLEEGGLRTTLINAVEAATKRAHELGEDDR